MQELRDTSEGNLDREIRSYLAGGSYDYCKCCGDDYRTDDDDVGLCAVCRYKQDTCVSCRSYRHCSNVDSGWWDGRVEKCRGDKP